MVAKVVSPRRSSRGAVSSAALPRSKALGKKVNAAASKQTMSVAEEMIIHVTGLRRVTGDRGDLEELLEQRNIDSEGNFVARRSERGRELPVREKK